MDLVAQGLYMWTKVKKGNCKEREAYCPHWGRKTIGFWGGWYDGLDPAIRTKDQNPLTHWWAQNNNFIHIYRKKWKGCRVGYWEKFDLQVKIFLKDINNCIWATVLIGGIIIVHVKNMDRPGTLVHKSKRKVTPQKPAAPFPALSCKLHCPKSLRPQRFYRRSPQKGNVSSLIDIQVGLDKINMKSRFTWCLMRLTNF